jgi:hypothetical protein
MPKTNRVQISEDTWQEIRNEYTTTDISMRGIQKKYGIPFNRIKDRVDREGWNDDREGFRSKINQKSIDLLVEHKAEECTRAFRVANKILDKIEAIVETIDESSPDALRDIKSATSSIKDLKEIGFFRAELDKKEQEARIRKLQKESEEDNRDTTINVVFEGDMDEYAD